MAQVTAEKVHILLADDHAVLRRGVRALLTLEPDLDVVGEAASGDEAVELVGQLHPSVVVMDLSMPGMDGLEATRTITHRYPGVRVLVLTAHARDEDVFAVLDAGGSGYVLKRQADQEIVEAVRAVARGEAYLYPGAVRLLLRRYREDEAPQGRSQLSEREREVLSLTAQGYSNAEIASRLYLSPKTVDTYRQRIMEKLDLRHRSELVRYALDAGLLGPSHSLEDEGDEDNMRDGGRRE